MREVCSTLRNASYLGDGPEDSRGIRLSELREVMPPDARLEVLGGYPGCIIHDDSTGPVLNMKTRGSADIEGGHLVIGMLAESQCQRNFPSLNDVQGHAHIAK